MLLVLGGHLSATTLMGHHSPSWTHISSPYKDAVHNEYVGFSAFESGGRLAETSNTADLHLLGLVAQGRPGSSGRTPQQQHLPNFEMLSAIRPNTYRTQMPSVTTEFFHFNGAEDEAAADLLATHILGLILKARKNALAKMLNAHNPSMNNKNEENRKKKNKVKSGLVNLLSKPGQVDVRLPADMMQRLVRDIVRMSEGEEHGIRGCTIIIQLIDGGASANIGRIVCDPKIKSSSLLQLRLARGPPPPHAVSHFSLFKFLNTNAAETVYISPGYTLEKRRLPTST